MTALPVTISKKSTLPPSNPCPSIRTSPPSTAKPENAPSAPKVILPVESAARDTLIKPQPSQVIPDGLAMTSEARPPNTSSAPRKSERVPPVTSFKIRLASPLFLRRLLDNICPPICDRPISLLLLKISPSLPTLSLEKTLYDVPSARGVAMLTIGVPPCVTSIRVFAFPATTGGALETETP